MDIATMLKDLQRQKCPLECPVCQKVYRSFSGISYHVIKFHSNGQIHNPTPNGFDTLSVSQSARKQPLSYADAQRMVEFDIKGNLIRNLISEPLDIEIEIDASEEEEIVMAPSPTKPPTRGTPRKRGRGRGRLVHYKHRYSDYMKKTLAAEEKKVPLPSAVYTIIPSEEILEHKVPQRTTYYRFIDKATDELDEEVEYGMDEEDYIWLEQINEIRKQSNLLPVSQEVLEMLLDRLEKESHFETRTITGDPYNLIDEDAVCSICCDGECSNSNVILFCDMCNLAVHQECYGVPYIPEGQWLCRKCLQSPSKPVDCLLCPTKSGAFKQTDTNGWAHVVCALWIPEVCFANTVFLEPIDSIANIPSARWKLLCYICKKKQGACIQCFKTNCYTAFHVTCAQQGGLYMKIEPGRTETGQATVKKVAYCDAHTPKHASRGFGTPCNSDYCSDEDSDTGSVHSKSSITSKPKNAQYQTPSAKLKEVQKKLIEKQSFKLPAVHIPFVPAHRLSKIVAKVAIAKKSQFIHQLQSYWMLKRQSRNGVPLLRRLQMNTGTGVNRNQREEYTLEELSQSKELKEQLRYWQQLRHDLERVRLLIELIRKREKMKKEQYRMKQQIIDLKLKPLQIEMERTLVLLQERDTTGIFAEPVKPEEAPDYHEFISNPMDFSTMYQKLSDYEYLNFDQFVDDFNLMVQNCLDFNHEGTLYYRAAVRLRTQCKQIIKAARKRIKQAGIDSQTGLHLDRPPALSGRCESLSEDDVSSLVENPFMTIDEKVEDLEQKLEFASTIQNALKRLARQKKLRKEIAKLRRQKSKMDHSSETDGANAAKAQLTTETPRVKKRGRKRRIDRERRNEVYNGEVKIEPKPTIPSDLRLDVPITEQVATQVDQTGEQLHTQDRLSPIFIEPEKVERNPSPGRSRRSGILFKKKQYQPVKPSPLVLYSSTTSDDDKRSPSSIKLKLRLESGGSNKVNGVGEFDLDNETLTSENEDPNIRVFSHSPSNMSKLSSPQRRDAAAEIREMNGIANGEVNEADVDDCFLDETETHSDANLLCSRKRTYTSSSANSDSEGNFVHRRKTSKRGRQRSTKLSLKQEFSDLEGLADIKYGIYMVNADEQDLYDPKCYPISLEMLTLTWAKCKGYPSYPALTIDPEMPRSGYQANGVPIPIPPIEVLQMNDDDQKYLVLFFDARRTWQWLPRDKMEPLGVDSRLDELKLIESKKPSMRKNVQEAYKRAITFRRRLEVGENSDGEEIVPVNGDGNGSPFNGLKSPSKALVTGTSENVPTFSDKNEVCNFEHVVRDVKHNEENISLNLVEAT
ncbi:bromodomain-containing protein 1-like isoform X1 [Hydractinia symbiolongicarpus]|uniref:bromodomain-containing protein 1-like isoform X1 n=1 Tax=Hydractinia symbiolongicarpus TaxID=13093 RepID=UPI00254E2581|nr:bromodomain-containing protein 1-like isoform X1 [Hydractinia symbiolongicarpus]